MEAIGQIGSTGKKSKPCLWMSSKMMKDKLNFMPTASNGS